MECEQKDTCLRVQYVCTLNFKTLFGYEKQTGVAVAIFRSAYYGGWKHIPVKLGMVIITNIKEISTN